MWLHYFLDQCQAGIDAPKEPWSVSKTYMDRSYRWYKYSEYALFHWTTS